jgi:uncharacterized peroxidase-related enzyme
MAWVRVIPPAEATGELKESYERAAKERGAVGDLFQATSLHPGVVDKHLALYKELQFADGPLSRRERELIATVVSRENGCLYCLAHHADAFGRHAKEPGLQALVSTDYRKAPLSPHERAIADHAVLLTKEPGKVTAAHVEKLRAAGLDDRAIVDVTLVTSYFN